MGENEQGGMLRTVVVVGLVALIAAVITIGVVGMKASMNKNTDIAVGTASLNQTVDSEFMNPIMADASEFLNPPTSDGSKRTQNSWFRIYPNSGSWKVAGKYRGSNYVTHTPEANEERSDLVSSRQEIPQNSKVVSYGAWVKGTGAIQISGFNNNSGSGDSWYWKWFNVSNWTYISENNVHMMGGTLDTAKYVSFDIISYHGDVVSLAQPMIKFTNNIGSVDYIPTD